MIGRKAEIERLTSILGRRTKNNPVLIGEAGVGKTAIVEGLALAISKKEVPETLLDKKILSLDLASLVAGSMFRGEFENRLKQVIDEVKQDPNTILFIDEIHRLNKTIEEVLYPAMESGSLDIIIGKGPSARTIQLDLPPFTLIAATTRIAMLSAPLRSRFSGGVFKLEFYTNEEIEKIVQRSAKILGIEIESEAKSEIAKRSRSTPRTANYLLKRGRDLAQVKEQSLTSELVQEALGMLNIDELGLNAEDRAMLTILEDKFNGGPVGLNTLAAALSEEQATIEEFNEPYLIQLGFLDRTPRGRIVTASGYEHLGLTPKTLL